MKTPAHTYITNAITAYDPSQQTPEQVAEQILAALFIPQEAHLEFVPLIVRMITVLCDRYLDVVQTIAKNHPISPEHQAQLDQMKAMVDGINFQYLTATLTP